MNKPATRARGAALSGVEFRTATIRTESKLRRARREVAALLSTPAAYFRLELRVRDSC